MSPLHRWAAASLLAVGVAAQTSDPELLPGSAEGRLTGRLALPAAHAGAIETGLAWLVAQQREDGSWAAGEGAAPEASAAVTSLAMLALLGDGNTLRIGTHVSQLKQATVWLRNQQRPDGAYADPALPGAAVVHAVATLAMNEAFVMSRYKLLTRNAQRGLDHLAILHREDGCWAAAIGERRGAPEMMQPCVAALSMGRLGGLGLEPAVLDGVEGWLDSSAATRVPERGILGAPAPRGFEAALRREQLAANVLTRFMASCDGADPLSQDAPSQDPPSQDPVSGKWLQAACERAWRWGTGESLYEWFCASHALAQAGGAQHLAALRRMAEALVAAQEPAGSWPPIGIWGELGGTAGTAAMALLVLEAPYRHARGFDR